MRAEHSPFLDLPPCLPARGSPSSPASPVDVEALQKPGHRACPSSQPLPLFPSIDDTPSTPGKPPPAFSPAHHLQALLFTSGSDTGSHLPGKCRQPRGRPPPASLSYVASQLLELELGTNQQRWCLCPSRSCVQSSSCGESFRRWGQCNTLNLPACFPEGSLGSLLGLPCLTA